MYLHNNILHDLQFGVKYMISFFRLNNLLISLIINYRLLCGLQFARILSMIQLICNIRYSISIDISAIDLFTYFFLNKYLLIVSSQ